MAFLARAFRFLPLGDVRANTDNAAIACAVLGAQDPAAIAQLPLLAVMIGAVGFQTIANPSFRVIEVTGSLTALRGRSGDVVERCSGNQHILDPWVVFTIFLVAMDQAFLRVVVDEALADAFDGIGQTGFRSSECFFRLLALGNVCIDAADADDGSVLQHDRELVVQGGSLGAVGEGRADFGLDGRAT